MLNQTYINNNNKNKKAIFFDDEPINIETIRNNCSDILPILIDKTPINLNKYIDYHKPNYTFIQANIYNNNFAKEMLKNDYYESRNPTEGFTYKHIHILIKWIKNSKNIKRRFALFDWDQTLSVCSGLINNNLLNKNTNLNDKLEYYLGGKTRKKFIIDTFKYLENNNIEVYIVTHNGIASKKNKLNRDFFLYLLKGINNNIEDKHLIFSGEGNYDKSEKIKKNIPELCNIKYNSDSQYGGKFNKIYLNGKNKSTKNKSRKNKSRKNKSRKNKSRKNKNI